MRALITLAVLLATLATARASGEEDTVDGDLLPQQEIAEPAPLERLPDVTGQNGRPAVDPESPCHCGGTCEPGQCDCEECLTYYASVQKSWYFRVEHFVWAERADGDLLTRDTGVLPTIGFFRRAGQHQTRLELFGNQMVHESVFQSDSANASYLGGRVEHDYFFSARPKNWADLLVGIGLRMWDRNIQTDEGFHELWVSLYPYLGWETWRNPSKPVQFFFRTRLGLTAFTYELASLDPQVSLYPGVGVLSLLEFGVRGDRHFISARLESFSWSASPTVDNVRQPQASNPTVGGQMGFFY